MLGVRYESASRLESAVNLLYFYVCKQLFVCCRCSFVFFLQLGNESDSLQLQLGLGFSSQRTSLHCTIIEATLYTTSGQEMQVCISTQKYGCVCQVQTPNCLIGLFFLFFYTSNFLSFLLSFNCFDMVERLSLYEIQCSFAPSLNPHPYTACLYPLALQRSEGLK